MAAIAAGVAEEVGSEALANETCGAASVPDCQGDGMALLQSRQRHGEVGQWQARDKSLCAALRQAVSGYVLCGTHCNFYTFGSFNQQCHKLKPAFVVRPVSAKEVQSVIRLAREYRRTFSIRGAGHNYVCNAFKKDSVHLDMRKMRNFSFRAEGGYGYAQLGPGLTNGDLEELIPAGYQYAVGTCPSVGVAGFLLHGGSSPRTTWLGNTTLFSIDVLTADGEMLTVSADSPHEGLWTAMRMAGSSFGVATSLTVRLEPKPQRQLVFIPVNGSFDQLLAGLKQPGGDEEPWVGLFRFDLIDSHLNSSSTLRDNWFLKTSLPGHVTPESLGPALVGVAEQARAVGTELDVSAATLGHPTGWVWPEGVPDAGSSGRFFAEGDYKAAATVMHDFYQSRTKSCWYDLGPLKGEGEEVFLDISCYEVKAVGELRRHIDEHWDVMQAGAHRYYNLPLEGTPREVYWPNYDELAAIKDKWDPTNFFDVPNGIHPSNKP